MLIEWPDRFYHTTADTIDHIDPGSLRRNGTAAAACALWLAAAGPDEAGWLEQQAVGRFVGDLGRIYARSAGQSAEDAARSLRYRVERQKECLAWIGRLDGITRSGDARVASELERVAVSLGAVASENLDYETGHSRLGAAADWRVERVYPGPISHFAHVGLLTTEEQDAFNQLCSDHPRAAGCLYRRISHWIDGRRTLAEISERLFQETGQRDDEFLVPFVEALEKVGLVRVRRETAGL